MKPVVCITGGGTGIGLATAKRCLSAGYRVIICGRREAVLDNAIKALDHPDGYSYTLDIADYTAVSRLFKWIETEFGRLDCLVNNASIIAVDTLDTMSKETIDSLVSVNILGTVYCSKAAVSLLKHSDSPSIITVTSLGGIQGATKFPKFSIYSMTKGALVIFTEALAVELKEHGIRVASIAPGAVDTTMLKQAGAHLNTSTQPDDIAQSLLFLMQAGNKSGLTGMTMEIHSNE